MHRGHEPQQAKPGGRGAAGAYALVGKGSRHFRPLLLPSAQTLPSFGSISRMARTLGIGLISLVLVETRKGPVRVSTGRLLPAAWRIIGSAA